jgi:hypothetical protein
MKRIEAGPVNHKIDVETIRGMFESNLGCNPYKEIEVADLAQFLRTETSGLHEREGFL